MTSLSSFLDSTLGPLNWTDNQDTLAPLLTPSTSHAPKGYARALVTPTTTSQIQELVTFCAQHRIPITPQGGNTGRAEGALPFEGLLLSTAKLNSILNIDTFCRTALVEAGVILDTLNQALTPHDLLFPLALGASGSCHIGGNIATNAGGLNALKYGSTRAMILGLEAVMADGSLYSHLSPLRKDNRGYSLDNLLIGSEGTLGIITKASLRLVAKPKDVFTYLVSSSDVSSLLTLFSLLINNLEHNLSAAEIISSSAIEQAKIAYPHISFPLSPAPWYLLLEADSPHPTLKDTFQNLLHTLLMEAFENNLILDSIEAQNQEQRSLIWNWREYIVSAPAFFTSTRHFFRSDIAVPLSKLPELFTTIEKNLPLISPHLKSYPYGHMGDGNIHYNLYTNRPLTKETLPSYNKKVSSFIRDTALALGGTFSAEHGIGSTKTEDLRISLDPCHWELLKTLKKALDPLSIMNPHTLIPSSEHKR